MLVYRMENAAGRGPFRARYGMSWDMHEAMGLSPNVPECYHDRFNTPSEDGLDHLMTSRHLCGCENLRQFVKWFPRKCRQFLKDEGFEPVVYDVPDRLVSRGQHQVIFVGEPA